MTREEQAFAIALMKEDYATYCYFVHQGKWIDTKFHKFLAKKVQKFVETPTGNPIDILVISTPPQHGKSCTVTQTLPSWIVGKHPDKRCIVACYNDELAGSFGRSNRDKINEYGQAIFGIKLKKSTDRDLEIADHSGYVIFRGIQSSLTGRSADIFIIDDPIKNRAEADSITYRNRIWEEWQNSIKTRSQGNTKIIIIQTRWHEDDLSGRVIREEPNVEVVNIPCEAEENDILGRNIGDALCPEIGKGNEWLKSFKQSYINDSIGGGIRAWNALYQGRPTSAEGNIFKREWWQYYDTLPEEMPVKVISVDATFKGGDNSDFVAIEVWGKLNADFYLIDMIKKRMDFPETVAALISMNEKYPERHSILIEDKANGSAIIAYLKHEVSGIVAVQPNGGKEARANAVTGIVEAGNVYLPRFASFTNEFIEECASFPSGAHDDCVDAFTQALSRIAFWGAKPKPKEKTEMDKLKQRMLKQARRRYY